MTAVISDLDTNIGTGTNTTTHTFDQPPNLADTNYWFIHLALDGQPTITWPSGWTLVASGGASGTGGASGGLAYMHFPTAASAPATVDVTTDVAEKATCTSFRVSGANQTDPIDVVGTVQTNNLASYTITGLTTTVDDCLLLACVSSDSDVTPYTEDTGWTQILDQAPVDTGSASANLATKVKATAGVEADANWAQNISQEAIRFMVAIAPDAGGATVVELEARTVEVVVA